STPPPILVTGSVSLQGGTISPQWSLSVAAGGSLAAFGSITAGITNAGAVTVGDGNSSHALTVSGGYPPSGGPFVLEGPLQITGTFEEDGGDARSQSGPSNQHYASIASLQAAAFTQTGGTLWFSLFYNSFQIAGDFTFSGGQALFVNQSASIGG